MPLPSPSRPARPTSDKGRAHVERRSRIVPGLGLVTLALLATAMPARAMEDPAGIFILLDTDSDGRLSPAEVRRTPLLDRFTVLDRDADGLLSRRELGLKAPSGAAPNRLP